MYLLIAVAHVNWALKSKLCTTHMLLNSLKMVPVWRKISITLTLFRMIKFTISLYQTEI